MSSLLNDLAFLWGVASQNTPDFYLSHFPFYLSKGFFPDGILDRVSSNISDKVYM